MTGPRANAATQPSHANSVFLKREKLLLASLYGAIIVATAIVFVAVGLIGRTWPVFLGLAPLSYVLGLRHGVDADHISAIDNTTRKLLQQDQRPLTVGTWFSLGHSSIVVGLIVALVLAYNAVSSVVPALAAAGGLVGVAVSGGFLWIIGLINLVIAIEIYRIFKQLRRGQLDQKGLDEQLNKRGFMSRYFGRLFRIVNKPWQMYPVGVLFGLGFDTATEVFIITLALKYGSGAGGVPLWAVLTLPALFTVGMVLVDTTDGVMMRFAYGWAFLAPIRKIYYNLTITIISVLVAFVIGGVEVLGVIAGELRLTGGVWSAVNFVNGTSAWEYVGFAIIGLFAIAWLVSMAVYKDRKSVV
jgi:high-affinity nickel-transport protein